MKNLFVITFVFISLTAFSQAQKIFSNNGKYGLMNRDNEVILPAQYDTISLHNWINDVFDRPLAILRQGKKYSFALMQFWETRESTSYSFWTTTDSLKWYFSKDNFDTLYVLKEGTDDITLPIYANKWDSIKGLVQRRHLYSLVYRKEGKYGLITYESRRKDVENKHEPRGNIGEDFDYWKGKYSFTNVVIHPPKYDDPIPINPSNDLIISKDNKYGILRLNYHFEIPAQFDSIPIRLSDFFYAVKKNDLWGVIFLNEYDSIPNEIFPFKYKNLQHIKDGYRYLSFYKRNSGKIYSACVYLTDLNTPLRLKFIIGRRYAGDKKENVKVIDFIPKINDSEIIQSENHEYVIATNYEYDTEYIDSKNPTLFVFPLERPNEHEDRIVYQKDFVGGLYDSYDKEYYFHKKGMKSLLTYRIKDNDTFVLLNEFKEEENVTYNIFDKSISWNTGWVIKETTLKNNSYKYEIYNYSGEILYDITSKYQIAKLQEPSYSPAEPIVTFYSEPQKNGKRKRICMYNYEKRKFKK